MLPSNFHTYETAYVIPTIHTLKMNKCLKNTVKVQTGKWRIAFKCHPNLIATSEILLLAIIYLISNAPRVEHCL